MGLVGTYHEEDDCRSGENVVVAIQRPSESSAGNRHTTDRDEQQAFPAGSLTRRISRPLRLGRTNRPPR